MVAFVSPFADVSSAGIRLTSGHQLGVGGENVTHTEKFATLDASSRARDVRARRPTLGCTFRRELPGFVEADVDRRLVQRRTS